MFARPRERSLVLAALIASLVLVADSAALASETIKDAEWGPCDSSYTIDGRSGGPGVGFKEPSVNVNEQSVVIAAATGTKGDNWAKAGYECNHPDPTPPVYATKIKVTPVFDIYGDNLSCTGGFEVTSGGGGASFSCTGSAKHVTIKLHPATATCKRNVWECHYRYHDVQIIADTESVEDQRFREYCHSVSAAFIGPNGDVYRVGVPADPRFDINCVEA